MKSIPGYMDAIDYHHELGAAAGGTVVYPNLVDLYSNALCAKECGVVKVEIASIELVKEGTPLTGMSAEKWEDYEKTQEYRNHLAERTAHFKKLYEFYVALVKENN